MTGIMCAAISLATGIFQGIDYGFDWLVQLCAGAFVVFTTSIFHEARALKAFQVFTLFIIGAFLIFQNDDSSYIGIIVVSVAWMYLYTYGFMANGATVKTIAGVTALVTILAISTEGNFSSIMLRSMMTGVIFTAIWINARDLIDKARIADAMKVERLESTVVELLDAAMVLVEANEKRNKDGK